MPKEAIMADPVLLKPVEDADAHHLVVTTTEARQGETHHNVRYVLGISLMLALIAFAILYVVYS
jgi:hypothetical protein